eukprot:2226186-Amphidinium_carterae.1
MRSSPLSLPPLTARGLVDTLALMHDTAAGLDGWQFRALKALSGWCLAAFVELAKILQHIEFSLQWPQALMESHVALTPKTADSYLEPLQFRPITVLSMLYRLWAKTRLQQCQLWLAAWSTDAVFGCGKGSGADDLALSVALDMESPPPGQSVSAGIVMTSRSALICCQLRRFELRCCNSG